MDMTTLEKPQSTEIKVMVEGKANLERATTLRRRSLRSSLFRRVLMLSLSIKSELCCPAF